jgi:predicted nucleotidyltransferase
MIALEFPRETLAEVCNRHHVSRLSVFGSAVRLKDYGPDSDLDILVEFKSDAKVGLMAFARLGLELSTLLGRQVDLAPKDGLKPLIREEILRTAEVIFEA